MYLFEAYFNTSLVLVIRLISSIMVEPKHSVVDL